MRTSDNCGRNTCHLTDADHMTCLDKWLVNDRAQKQKRDDLDKFWAVRIEAIPGLTVNELDKKWAVPYDEQRDLGYDDLRDSFNNGGVTGWDAGNDPNDMPEPRQE